MKESNPDYRVGIGYDSHRFIKDRPLVLGGVIIPFDYGLDGHSDADVLLHALADAILGATGLGDIGMHFPDTDEKYKEIKSTILLSEVFKKIVEKGYRVSNVDAVIIAELPKMGPHVPIMRQKISRILMIDNEAVSVKATTNEGMGFVGRREGIAVMATAMIYKDDGTIIPNNK